MYFFLQRTSFIAASCEILIDVEDIISIRAHFSVGYYLLPRLFYSQTVFQRQIIKNSSTFTGSMGTKRSQGKKSRGRVGKAIATPATRHKSWWKFPILGAAALTAAGVATVVLTLSNGKGPETITIPVHNLPGYTVSVVRTGNEIFYGPEESLPVLVQDRFASHPDLDRLEDSALQTSIYNRLAGSGLTDIQGITALTLSDIVDTFNLPDNSPQTRQTITRAQATLEHLASYLQPLVLPDVQLIIPTTKEEVRSTRNLESLSDQDVLRIYAIVDSASYFVLTGIAKTTNKEQPFAVSIQTGGAAGETIADLQILYTKKGYRITSYKERVVTWDISRTPLEVLETPAAEVLHYLMNGITLAHYLDDLNVRPPTTWGDVARRGGAWRDVDELVTHGLHHAWFDDLNRDWKLGFDLKELRTPGRGGGRWWEHPGTEATADLAARIGPRAYIQQYSDAPLLLLAPMSNRKL
jgi:hypothetical protein